MYFDGCKIIEFNEKEKLLILKIHEDKDWDYYGPLFQRMINAGNAPVDLTFNYPKTLIGKVQCNKCKKVVTWLSPVLSRGLIPSPDFVPGDLKCDGCGEQIG